MEGRGSVASGRERQARIPARARAWPRGSAATDFLALPGTAQGLEKRPSIV
nr:hypothetical protein RVX_3098 [Nitratidesulfovibrio sp. HK-II]